MKGGTLRNRIAIDEPMSERDETGDPVQTWQEVATVWAAIEPARGREYLRANQIVGSSDLVVRMRYTPTTARIRQTWRLRHRMRALDIVAITNPNTRDAELELVCRWGVTDGR